MIVVAIAVGNMTRRQSIKKKYLRVICLFVAVFIDPFVNLVELFICRVDLLSSRRNLLLSAFKTKSSDSNSL